MVVHFSECLLSGVPLYTTQLSEDLKKEVKVLEEKLQLFDRLKEMEDKVLLLTIITVHFETPHQTHMFVCTQGVSLEQVGASV